MIKVTGAGTCKGSSSGAVAPAGSVLAPGSAPSSAPAVNTLAVISAPPSATLSGPQSQAAAASPQCSLGSPPGMKGPIMYSGCIPVAMGSEADFHLLWNVNGAGGSGRRRLQNTATPARSNVSIGIDASAGKGWAAIGLPQTPGQMIGADAVIIRTCSSCPSGSSSPPHLLFHALAQDSYCLVVYTPGPRVRVRATVAWRRFMPWTCGSVAMLFVAVLYVRRCLGGWSDHLLPSLTCLGFPFTPPNASCRLSSCLSPVPILLPCFVLPQGRSIYEHDFRHS